MFPPIYAQVQYIYWGPGEMPEYGKIKYLHMFLYGEDLH